MSSSRRETHNNNNNNNNDVDQQGHPTSPACSSPPPATQPSVFSMSTEALRTFPSPRCPQHMQEEDNETRCESKDNILRVLKSVTAHQGFASHHLAPWNYIVQRIPGLVQRYSRKDIVVPELGRHDVMTFRNGALGHPAHIAADTFLAPLYPDEARWNRNHYAAPLYATVDYMEHNYITGKTIYRTWKNKIMGWVPVMVGSDRCLRSLRSRSTPSEGHDPNGYFIVGGTPKVITPKQNARMNRITVFTSYKKDIDLYAEVRPKESGRIRSSSTLCIEQLRGSKLLMVKIPFINVGVPVFAMFRMLGVATRQEVVNLVCSAGMLSGRVTPPKSHVLYAPNVRRKIIGVLQKENGSTSFPNIGCVPDYERMSPEDVMDWFGSWTVFACQGYTKKVQMGRSDRVSAVKKMFASELLPHVGTREFKATRVAKVRYLAYMVWRILRVSMGHVLPDRREDFANKSVVSSAWLVLVRLRQTYESMLKTVAKHIKKELSAKIPGATAQLKRKTASGQSTQKPNQDPNQDPKPNQGPRQGQENDAMRARPEVEETGCVDICALFDKYSFNQNLWRAMSSGDFSARRKSKVPPASRPMSRVNVKGSSFSEICRVDKSVKTENTQAEKRCADGTQRGYIDMCNSSEGEKAGINNKAAMTMIVSRGASVREMFPVLTALPLLSTETVLPPSSAGTPPLPPSQRAYAPPGMCLPLKEEPPLNTYRQSNAIPLAGIGFTPNGKPLHWSVAQEDAADAAILERIRRDCVLWFVNGVPLKVVLRGSAAAAHDVRCVRRYHGHEVPRTMSVYLSIEDTRELYVSCELGGPRRPLFVVEDMSLRRVLHMVSTLCARNCNRELLFSTLQEHGVIEYVDALEERNLIVRPSPLHVPREDGFTVLPAYTHVELHPMTMLGFNSLMVPALDMNQTSRVIFSGCMSKNALQSVLEMYMCATSLELETAQKPLVTTTATDILGAHDMPMGLNVPVTCIPGMDGYNVEDSLCVSRRAVELGMGAIVVHNTYRSEITTDCYRSNGSQIQEFAKSRPGTRRRKRGNYDSIEQDGMPRIGSVVRADDVIIGKIQRQGKLTLPSIMPTMSTHASAAASAANGNVQECVVKDASEVIPAGIRDARVAHARCLYRDNKRVHAAVTTRHRREVTMGDKFSTRHANKSTIARIIDAEDMPDVQMGNPHAAPAVFLMNPQSLPTRMAAAGILETQASMLAALRGKPVVLDPWDHVNAETVKNELKEEGYWYPSCKQPMIHGMTGKMSNRQVSHGIRFYHRMRQMAQDFCQTCTLGPISKFTHHPQRGRRTNNAMKFGHMEKDAVCASGASSLMVSRACAQSDGFYCAVCAACGLPCDVNAAQSHRYATQRTDKRATCLNCGTDEHVYNVFMPFTMLRIMFSLAAAGMAMRLSLGPSDTDVDYVHGPAAGWRVPTDAVPKRPNKPAKGSDAARRAESALYAARTRVRNTLRQQEENEHAQRVARMKRVRPSLSEPTVSSAAASIASSFSSSTDEHHKRQEHGGDHDDVDDGRAPKRRRVSSRARDDVVQRVLAFEDRYAHRAYEADAGAAPSVSAFSWNHPANQHMVPGIDRSDDAERQAEVAQDNDDDELFQEYLHDMVSNYDSLMHTDHNEAAQLEGDMFVPVHPNFIEHSGYDA